MTPLLYGKNKRCLIDKKSIQGSFNQGHDQFGETAGFQCSCNALFSICWSKLRKIKVWKSIDLDYILEEGDKNFKLLNILRYLYVDELPYSMQIEGEEVCVFEQLKVSDGEIKSDCFVNFIDINFMHTTKTTGAVFFIKEFCFAFFVDQFFYIFDSHSRDAKGDFAESGSSVLLKFETLKDVETYVRDTYYDEESTNSLYFQILYVKGYIESLLTLRNKYLQGFKRKQKSLRNKIYSLKIQTAEKCVLVKANKRKNSEIFQQNIVGTQQHEEIKSKKRKISQKSHQELVGTQQHESIKSKKRKNSQKSHQKLVGTQQHESIKSKKRKNSQKSHQKLVGTQLHETIKSKKRQTSKKSYKDIKKTQKQSKSRVKAFKNLIKDGPYFICVSCNRCLYKRSVVVFKPENYHCEIIQKCSMILSFNGTYYICGTCHKKMKKNNIPCQSVSNKLELYEYPVQLRDIRKLERVLISQRILFSKVVILPKGQFPKIKGAICNIPIQADSVCDILPRGINSSGVIYVQLKRKLSHLSNVYSEPVRPSKLIAFLQYLKENNSLYSNITINLLDVSNFPVPVEYINDDDIEFVVNKPKEEIKNKSNIPQVKFIDDKNVQQILTVQEENDKVELENPLIIFKTPAIKTALISEVPHLIAENNGKGFVVPGKGKSQVKLYIPQVKFIDDKNVQQILAVQDESDEFEEENPLNIFKTPAIETVLISEVPHLIAENEENAIVAPGEGKSPISILQDEFCEEVAHPHLFPTGKFGYKVERDINLSPTKYFNQRLLNYTQKFASDPDYIFYAHYVLQQLNLKSKINIAMRKVTGQNITAGMFSQNFQDTIKSFVATDEAYRFMNTVKGTPAYWKNMLSDVLAMVKQLGLPTYFLTLSCADLRWNELVLIISRLKGVDITEKEIENLSYFERCELLNSNPVLLARHFQYRVETFFKEIVLNGQLGKFLYYAIRVEFQVRGSPHIHCLLWASDAPKLNAATKSDYANFVDSVISANIPNRDKEHDLLDLVRTYQVHSHSKSCKKYKKKECRFDFGHYFTNKTIIAEPLCSDILPSEKIDIVCRQTEILHTVKKFINENLNPKKRNFLDPDKPNYEILGSIEDILTSLDITLQVYEWALSISTDNDYQIHVKRNPNSCFVNNYFVEGLLAWEANIDIQPVFNYYKAVTYMCAYFSKSEDKCSTSMTEALANAKEQDASKFDAMVKVAKAYSNNRECSVQEAVYLMPELWLRKCFPATSFVNTNPPEKRFKICKTEEEILELPEDSPDVFKKNILDRYIDRPNSTFDHGKYSVLDSMCYAEFCAHYRLDYKDDLEKNDNQPDVLVDKVIEENHQVIGYPLKIPLMSSKEKLICRKVRKVLRYYTPNKHKYPERYARHLLMLFFPFRNEETDLIFEGSSVLKLNDSCVNGIVNINKKIFEPDAEIVELALNSYREDIRHNQDAFGQQENDEVIQQLPADVSEDEDMDNDSPIEQNLPPPADCGPTLLSDDKLNDKIASLNQKQRQIFDVVFSWAKQFVQNRNSNSELDLTPLLIFLSGGGGCGKSHLIKCIYHSVTKLLTRGGTEIEKPKVLLIAPTGVAAINIEGTTIHTGLGIPCNHFTGLGDKQRTSLRNKLCQVELIIIDEISMVSSKLLLQVHQRICEIFGTSEQIPFAKKSVIVCGDLFQLPPVMAKPVFSLDGLLISVFRLWHLFKFAELTEVMRQQGDNLFIDLLNNIRVGNIEPSDEILLKSKFISNDSSSYPWQALHLFAENSAVNCHNRLMLDSLSTTLIPIPAIDDYPKDISKSDIKMIKEKKQSDTGGLAAILEIKLGVRIMITCNIDIDDRLINGQIGTIIHVRFNKCGKVDLIYIKFDDEKAGLKKQRNDRYAVEHNCVPVEHSEAKFNLRRNKTNSPLIKRTQFPMMLSYACTVHKVQGLSLKEAVISFSLEKQRKFNPGQMYVALSRVTSLNGLFLLGQYAASHMNHNKTASDEYCRLRKKENLLKPLQDLSISEDSLTLTLLNVRSLKRHAVDLKADMCLRNTDVLFLTETQLHSCDDVANIRTSLEEFEMFFYNHIDKYQSLAIGYKDCLISTDYVEPGKSLIKLKKNQFSEKAFAFLLLYRSHSIPINSFLNSLYQLVNRNNIDVILGDFNIDGLCSSSSNIHLKEVMFEYKEIVNLPTHIDGGHLDHIYVRKNIFNNFDVSVIKRSLNLSDHDAIKVKFLPV